MKKIIFTLGIVLAAFVTNAQNCFWHENFDAPSLADSVISSSSSGNPGWSICSRLQTSPNNSDSAFVDAHDTVALSTTVIDLTGQTFVLLDFDQICKTDFFDVAKVEVSIDGGIFFTQLTCSQYLGGSPGFCGQNNQFSHAAYSTWLPLDTDAVATNAWWKHETFDISSIAGGQSQVVIRWRAYDSNVPDTSAAYPLNGWKIDDICVTAAPCELTPPVITQNPPVLTGTVYNLGPYTLNIDATDASGIANANLIYTINGGSPVTVAMTNTGGSGYQGQIPAVNADDTVCYFFQAIDASACNNVGVYPSSGCIQFIAAAGITFPFCDNFDSNNLWTDSLVAGSQFQLGTPTTGIPSAPHSPPNVWDVALNSAYVDNTNCYLNSPHFSFAGIVGAEISMWINYDTEFSFDFGTVEYSTDGGILWNTLDNPGNTTNWYNDPAGWTGNSGGWLQAKCLQPSALDNQADVILRFHFTADFIGTGQGFAVDDFCITPPSPFDAGVTQINQPGLNAAAGQCVDVIVTLKNFGLNPLTSFDVFWTDGTTTFGPTLWTGNLAPGATTTFTLDSCFNVPVGTFNVCAYTDLTGDGNNLNDTTCLSGVGVPVLTLTSCDDLESGNLGYAVTSSGGGSDWELGTPNFGQTTGAHSGVNAWDVNLNTAYNVGTNCTLTTPIYNLITPPAVNPSFSFWQNRNVDNQFDGMRVEYTVNGGTTWIILGNVNDPDATNWYNNPSVNFTGFPGFSGNSVGWSKSTYFLTNILAANPGTQFIQFRFYFESGFPFPTLDGISIDDICVTQPDPVDGGVVQIVTPTAGGQPVGNTSPVEVTIRNFGSQPITTTDIVWTIDGVPQSTTTFNGNLAPGAVSGTITLNGTLTFPSGQFELCAYTQLASDADITNDTTCITLVGIPIIPLTFAAPYCDDFEGPNAGWSVITDGDPGSVWELGTPAFGQTTGAHSGTSCWDVNLNTIYTSNANTTLYSPFFDFTNAIYSKLSMYMNFNTEELYDGVRMEYSISNGPWTLLNTTSPGSLYNWYNVQNVFCSNQPAWANTSTDPALNPDPNGWINVQQNDLSLFNGQAVVQFRFVFCADGSFEIDGFSIDDFCLTPAPPFDAGVTQIIQPNGGAPLGNCEPVIVTIKNLGSNPITSLDVYYSDGTTTFGPFPWTGNLTSGQSITDTLPCFTIPAGTTNLCSWTALLNDGNPQNDTTCTDVIGVPIIVLDPDIAYCDNFDGVNNGWTASSLSGSPFVLGPPGAGNAHSAPNVWSVGIPAYLDNSESYVLSPIFDFSNMVESTISIWNRFSTESGFDFTRIEYTLDGSSWVIMDNPGNTTNWYNNFNGDGWDGASGGWQEATCLQPAALNNQSYVRFRFYFHSDGIVTDNGFAFDDLCITPAAPFLTASPVTINNNAAIATLIFTGQPLLFNSTISNTGSTLLSSVVAGLYVDNVLALSDTINISPPITKYQSVNHVFGQQWLATPGSHTICVITSYPNQGIDQNLPDDTICITMQVIDTVGVNAASPYCNDFESGPQWVTLNSITYLNNSSWQVGMPAQATLNSTHSGVNAWTTGLTANYPDKDTSALFTPAFNIVAGENYRLSFWQEYATEIYQDGGNVELSTDYGASWYYLGNAGQGSSWYNAFFVTALGGTPPAPGWSGTLGVWQQATHDICFNQSGSVIFRFHFASDYSVTDEGWAIDDFCLEDLSTTCNLGIEDNSNVSQLVLGQNHPNPANGMTSIDYIIPEKGKVSLRIVNLLGQVMETPVDREELQGRHTVDINANKLAPGIYYYSLTFNNKEMLVKKMVITK